MNLRRADLKIKIGKPDLERKPTNHNQNCSTPGQYHPRGVTMRACKNDRGGFDRVLMAVAATFLTVSATSAMAQDPSRSTPAELAIDAAIPRPEPANVPPPTAADFKMDTTASTPPAVTQAARPAETNPASVATAPVPAPVTADHATLAPAVPLGAPTVSRGERRFLYPRPQHRA